MCYRVGHDEEVLGKCEKKKLLSHVTLVKIGVIWYQRRERHTRMSLRQ